MLGLSFSSNGRILASAGWDNAIRLWDAATGTELRVLRLQATPWTVVFSPDSRLLASGGQNTRALIIWDASTGTPLHTLNHSVSKFAFTPDGQRLAGSLAANGKIHIALWDVATGEESARIESNGTVVATRTHTVVFDSATGEQLHSIPEIGGEGRAVALSPDNSLAACSTKDRRVVVVRVETGQPVVEDVHRDLGWAATYSPDGKRAMTHHPWRSDPTVRLWDLSSGRSHTLKPMHPTVSAHCAAFSPDGMTLATGSHDRTIRLWDFVTGQERCTLWKLGQRADAHAVYEELASLLRNRPSLDVETERSQEEAAAVLGLPAPRQVSQLPPVAIDTAGRALALLTKLSELDEQSRVVGRDPWPRRKLAADYFQLAQSLREMGEAIHAEAACRSSYALFARLVGDDPNSPRFLLEAGLAANLFRDLLVESNRKEEALPIARAAAAWQHASRHLRPNAVWQHAIAAHSSRQLAGLLRELGYRTEVEEAEQQSIAAAEAADAEGKFPAFSELIDSARPLMLRRDWKGAAEVVNDGLVGRRIIDPELCSILGLIQLLAGDTDGYADLMASMPRQFMSHEWPYQIVRTHNLGPHAATDPAAQVALAREALASGLAPATDWGLTNLATALYRAGQYDEALTTIAGADPSGEVRDHWPIRAMIHFSAAATAIHWAPRLFDGGRILAPANLPDWQRRWNLIDRESFEGIPRFHGGDLLPRAAITPEKITPDDFRLRPDSAGYRAGPDGKHLGADVDLVGPGAAYERWKRTPEYQEWLVETGQLKE